MEILYGTYAVACHKNGDKIDAVMVENKSGRQAISVRSVVDATGDCDIAWFADAPTEKFKQGNVLAAWYYFTSEAGYKLKTLGFCDIPDDQKTADHKDRMLVPKRFTGLSGDELSELTVLSHASTLNDVLQQRKTDPAVFPTTIATTPQIRMTRKIAGEYELAHTELHRYFEDSIGMVSNWKKRGPVYEVPFRTLYNRAVKNLIVAGRCTSVNETLWDVMRVIPCCAVTGQAAGTAAAMTDDFTALNIGVLQQKLRENGVVLHEEDLEAPSL